jgi:hypothetical protein
MSCLLQSCGIAPHAPIHISFVRNSSIVAHYYKAFVRASGLRLNEGQTRSSQVCPCLTNALPLGMRLGYLSSQSLSTLIPTFKHAFPGIWLLGRVHFGVATKQADTPEGDDTCCKPWCFSISFMRQWRIIVLSCMYIALLAGIVLAWLTDKPYFRH